ncbi:MAG: hypothetical protein KC442_15920, partial [Thermomicrobiales bacterium]|nr:hypothetical protein [Thermomicrobiales bacterium]
AAGVTGETRAGRRRKRQRRRMRRPGGAFRTSSVKVANRTREPLHVSLYQPKRGTGDHPPVTDGKTYAVLPDSWETYAPGQFRVGVLIHNLDPQDDLYVDMRNVLL